ncbi:hypothetical protein S245_066786 [Arachis hypogaea]
MAIFPVSFLFSNSLKFPAKSDDILKQYEFFPMLSVQNQHLNSEKGPRRVHLELYLGFMVKMNGHLDSGSKEETMEKEKEIMKRADEKYDKEEAAASEDEEF